MRPDGQEHARAEDLERLLPAFDERLKQRPFERRPIARQKAVDEEGKDDEVQEAIRCQVGLVVRIERIEQPNGHRVTDLRESSGHRHDEGEQ